MTTEYLNNKKFTINILNFQKSKREKVKYEICIEDLKDAVKRGNTKILPRLEKLTEMYKKTINIYNDSQQQLAIAFQILAENIVNYAKFNFVEKEDVMQDSVMTCFYKIDLFNPTKGRAFNYMTTIIWNTLRQSYRGARTHNELKNKFLEFLQCNNDNNIPRNKNKNNIKLLQNNF